MSQCGQKVFARFAPSLFDQLIDASPEAQKSGYFTSKRGPLKVRVYERCQIAGPLLQLNHVRLRKADQLGYNPRRQGNGEVRDEVKAPRALNVIKKFMNDFFHA